MLSEKVTQEGWVYVEVHKGIYGLPQAGLLALELLANMLVTHGYTQSTLTPDLWTDKTRPIQFCLMVDYFGVKYVGKQHANHLKSIVEQHWELSSD